MTNIEQLIIKLFDDQGKDYLNLNQLKKQSQIRKLLQLTEEMDNTKIKKTLLPHLENELRVTHGYKGLYVTRNISDADLIISSIRKKPRSLGKLKLFFPVKTNKLMKMVAQMIMDGQLCVEFTETCVINLSINENKPEKHEKISQNEVDIQPTNDRQKMKKAYDHVGGGRSFVRIHAMRDYLNWPRKRFDQTLEELTRELAIQLHFGDPSVLTQKQLEDSYVDDEGQVCITITWRDV
jgi:hypothetical protein